MAEYVYNPIQLVQPNQAVLLEDSIPCNKGYVYHRDGSGNLILRGITPNCFARYQVTFNGNISLPTGATAGEIAVALAIDGEPINTSIARVPATVDDYFNVTSTAIITVPKGCCLSVSVENVSAGATPTATPPPINVQNANTVVSRIA